MTRVSPAGFRGGGSVTLRRCRSPRFGDHSMVGCRGGGCFFRRAESNRSRSWRTRCG